jgi:outer membrane protein OmpA-like peptidoglycan-associated protein
MSKSQIVLHTQTEMKKEAGTSMLSEDRPNRSLNRLLTAVLFIAALLAVSGCSSDSEKNAASSSSASGRAGAGETGDEPFPKLGEVPETPRTTTAEERAQLTEGLVADNQQREYSEEVIAFQSEPAESLPAPNQSESATDAEASSAVAPPFSGGIQSESVLDQSQPPAAPAVAPPVSASATPQPMASPPVAPLAAATAQPTIPSTQIAAAMAQPTPGAPEITAANIAALGPNPTTNELNRAQLQAVDSLSPPISAAPGAPSLPAAMPAPMVVAAPIPVQTAVVVQQPSSQPPPQPVGVQEVFEARLQESLPSNPAPLLPPAGVAIGGPSDPLATVVVSSSGTAPLEESPVFASEVPFGANNASVSGSPQLYGTNAQASLSPGAVKVATILFEDGSAHLRSREREIVRNVYAIYKQRGGKVAVVGHASSRTRNMDPIRHQMVNHEISVERATAVARELERLGVPRARIAVIAVADSRPLYAEVMPAGEAGNRRTEIYLDY